MIGFDLMAGPTFITELQEIAMSTQFTLLSGCCSFGASS